MIIPKLHYSTQGNSSKEILENVQKACASGAELVRLRCENVSEKKYLKLAVAVQKITAHYQTRLILCGHYKIAKDLKVDGVYLEKTDACPTLVRKQLYAWQTIGGTANNIEDCETLLNKGINYIGLGPFKASNTHLGLKGFAAITDVLKTPIPIIGFGGITTTDVTAILETGISGIAVSDAITQDFDSIKVFNQLLNASATQEQRYTFK